MMKVNEIVKQLCQTGVQKHLIFVFLFYLQITASFAQSCVGGPCDCDRAASFGYTCTKSGYYNFVAGACSDAAVLSYCGCTKSAASTGTFSLFKPTNASVTGPPDFTFPQSSIDNFFLGIPWFSNHASNSLMRRMEEYKKRQLAMYAKIEADKLKEQIPSTGDKKGDELYAKEYLKLTKKDTPPPIDILDKPVQLMGGSPMTLQELEMQKLKNQFGPNYAENANMFVSLSPNNSIDEKKSKGASLGEDAFSAAFRKLPLPEGYAEVRDKSLEYIDKSFEGIEKGTDWLVNGMQGEPPPVGADIVVNEINKENATNYVTGKATEMVGSLGKEVSSYIGEQKAMNDYLVKPGTDNWYSKGVKEIGRNDGANFFDNSLKKISTAKDIKNAASWGWDHVPQN